MPPERASLLCGAETFWNSLADSVSSSFPSPQSRLANFALPAEVRAKALAHPFEVFPSLAVATNGKNKKATSQLALPEDACKLVFATAGYEASVQNMTRTTLKNDNVFSDGVSTQTPTMSGDIASGYTAKLNVGI